MAGNTISEAVLLIGGKGTRLQSVVNDRPKPLAMVGGRPFVEWLLLLLRVQGVRRVVLSTGYLAEMFPRHFGTALWQGMELVYSPETAPLGTGGAVRQAMDCLEGPEVLALNGDSFCRFELERLVQRHRTSRAQATLWLAHVPDAGRYGLVDLGAEGRVRAFREKDGRPLAGEINAGIYLLERSCLEQLPAGQALSLERDLFPRLATRGQLASVAGDGVFLDIGTPEAYRMAAETLSCELEALQHAVSTSFTVAPSDRPQGQHGK